MYHLTTIRPHEDDDRGMTARDFAVYCRGYYTALRTALRALEFVLRKRETRRRELRRITAARRAARRLVVDEPSGPFGIAPRVGQQGMLADRQQRTHEDEGNFVMMFDRARPEPEHDAHQVAQLVDVEATHDRGQGFSGAHCAERSAPSRSTQPVKARARTSKRDRDQTGSSPAHRAGALADRHESTETLPPLAKDNTKVK